MFSISLGFHSSASFWLELLTGDSQSSRTVKSSFCYWWSRWYWWQRINDREQHWLKSGWLSRLLSESFSLSHFVKLVFVACHRNAYSRTNVTASRNLTVSCPAKCILSAQTEDVDVKWAHLSQAAAQTQPYLNLLRSYQQRSWWGNSLAVQRLGLCTFLPRPQVWSLVEELRSHKSHGMAKKIKR